MKKILLLLVIPALLACQAKHPAENKTVRAVVDTVGFAHLDWQMDAVVALIDSLQGDPLEKARKATGMAPWKVALCPHDDYAYAGYLYPATLEKIRAETVILIGVAHKARQRGLEDRIIFDSYDQWAGPYGPVTVSLLREEILDGLPGDLYVIDDTMHAMEHSLEALIPFLQYYSHEVEIIPILVPYMDFSTMDRIARPLADQLHMVMEKRQLSWGEDFAIVISSDAVHYGDEDWGGKDFAFYGADSIGYQKAVTHEKEIISECLSGNVSTLRLERFTTMTVMEHDHREYKWTWCGRYSVPFGLLTALHLEGIYLNGQLQGTLVGYETSLSLSPVPVEKLGMGTTAPASIRHWVGYAAIGYR